MIILLALAEPRALETHYLEKVPAIAISLARVLYHDVLQCQYTRVDRSDRARLARDGGNSVPRVVRLCHWRWMSAEDEITGGWDAHDKSHVRWHAIARSWPHILLLCGSSQVGQ
jgi:hypothetical protein